MLFFRNISELYLSISRDETKFYKCTILGSNNGVRANVKST